MKIGIGYDVHRFEENRKLVIGGVDIPYEKGLNGHSDGDVLVHAIMDSIVGALGEGDIGRHFPDNDEKYKNIYSIKLLEKIVGLMEEKEYKIGNIDCIIVAEEPKMMPNIEKMKNILSETLKTSKSNLNIKATTTEKLGFEGRKEGISAQAIVLLTK